MRSTSSPGSRPRLLRGLILLGAAAVLCGAPRAQVRFSIDWHGPTKGRLDSGAHVPISEGDLLVPATGRPMLGPLPAPRIAIGAGPGGLNLPAYAGCATPPFGAPCQVEVDALSLGRDARLEANAPLPRGRLWFSVDEFARGGNPPSPAPSVGSEWASGDSSADVFAGVRVLPPGPLAPGSVGGGGGVRHRGVIDGDGLKSASGARYPCFGLIEPNPPTNQPPPDLGDNVDALDVHDAAGTPGVQVYFSLEGGVVDPITGLAGSQSAAANGGSGADVFVAFSPAMAPAVWASGAQLGLGLTAAGEDDVDALILRENGSGVFEPSRVPYDWVSGQRDMLLFSVRRGSDVIGRPDSIHGLPIAPGDILTTPLPPALGGLSPFPGIFIAAEVLGLRAARDTTVPAADDVDGLDVLGEPLFDCNGNDVEDSVDIALGTSNDDNLNGVPDECEVYVVAFCHCAQPAPCGNADPGAGCATSTGSGAALTAAGSTSVTADELVLATTGIPPGQFGLYFMGDPSGSRTPFGDGLRCTQGNLLRWPVENAGPAGVLVLGPGLVEHSLTHFPNVGQILPGSSWSFQAWFRDPAGPCGSGWNASNAVRVGFVP